MSDPILEYIVEAAAELDKLDAMPEMWFWFCRCGRGNMTQVPGKCIDCGSKVNFPRHQQLTDRSING